MKAGDTGRVSCLRLLKTSLKNLQLEKGQELKNDEIQAILFSSVKTTEEAAEGYRRGDSEDLALKEEQEIKYFYAYLPRQLTAEEIEKTLKRVIDELSAKNSKDLGKIMKTAMAKMTIFVQTLFKRLHFLFGPA